MISTALNFMAEQFGFDIKRFAKGIQALPRYFVDLIKFKRISKNKIVLRPCLHDRQSQSGTAKGEYFWQDLYVARKIHDAKPNRHVDIGSRVDGFVAHVASFREIEVIDIRPMDKKIPGILTRQLDMMDINNELANCYDSLSSLHALEHFGLGRYGDPLDTDGHVKGLGNFARIVKAGGILYVSLPIGIDRVEFNANRVVCPVTFVTNAERLGLHMARFSYYIRALDEIIESKDPLVDLKRLSQEKYALGIFTFVKSHDTKQC